MTLTKHIPLNNPEGFLKRKTIINILLNVSFLIREINEFILHRIATDD